jgi:hypothetical protein
VKIFIFIVFSTLCINQVCGQSPGLVIQGGVSASYSKDPNITNSGQAHYGWMLGADGRLLDGNIYFIIGGQYHQTNLVSTSLSKIFSEKDWQILMTRFGLGFNVITFSERLALRSKLLGSINFILDSPEDGLKIPGYTKVNDSYLGITTGVGITIGSIDLDLDYQYGIINAIYQQPKSTFDSLTLMAGFHF